MSEHDELKPRYDDGNLYALTLGEFIGLLVDAGHDPAVLFRVAEDGPVDKDGKFFRRIEVTLLPDGYVKNAIDGNECYVHKTLIGLINAGVVK